MSARLVRGKRHHNENMCRDWHVVDAAEEDHYYGCLEMECWRCYYALLLTATSIAHRDTAERSRPSNSDPVAELHARMTWGSQRTMRRDLPAMPRRAATCASATTDGCNSKSGDVGHGCVHTPTTTRHQTRRSRAETRTRPPLTDNNKQKAGQHDRQHSHHDQTRHPLRR